MIKIYTDGACRGNPGPGGWGVIVISGEETIERCGGDNQTTNNRMELMAAIEGLSMLDSTETAILFTDSKYVMLGITQWMPGWKKRNWVNASRKPVKNRDLWERLDELAQTRDIDWRWVKGHAGDAGNERADQLANQGLDEHLAEGFSCR